MNITSLWAKEYVCVNGIIDCIMTE